MSNKFTQKAQNTLNFALSVARELGHSYIGSEHILLGLLSENDSIASRLLTARGADAQRLRESIISVSGLGCRSQVTPADMTPRARRVIELSAKESARCGNNYIGTEHILYALLSEKDCSAVRLLESEGIPASEVIGDLNAFIYSTSTKCEGAKSRQDSKAKDDEKQKIKGAPMLSAHGKDLTAAAKEGKLDPIVGREAETERVIRILSRRTKNNPCLIGEAGVGKTAVVEGLAQRIASRKVPDALLDKRIITLNIPSMIAGAKYRGEFEDRMKAVMEEVEKDPDIILFIDEMHVIVGAGAAEGAVDAANIIKPALSRGKMRVIGATTIGEYRLKIEKDPALERRFQAVTVNEPTKEEALQILEGLRSRYEEHHHLSISEDAMRAAIELSVRYVPERHLPDKAIDLIDEAASKLRITGVNENQSKEATDRLMLLADEKENAIKSGDFELAASVRAEEDIIKQNLTYNSKEYPYFSIFNNQNFIKNITLNEEHIAEVLTEWTGIPTGALLEGESEKLIRLEENLRKEIKGQDEAIKSVSQAVRRGRIGLKDPRRPIGSFIFIGKTGVGKTKLAQILASEFFGSEKALIRFDMSEYMEKHSVSKLIGSPPGYVGYEDGGLLTERIRRRPYSVVLFDEIEKAHPDIFNILLQILEDGCLTDSQGRKALFANSIIIMTSNLGAESKNRILGFSNNADDAEKAEMTGALKRSFSPELLGRVDEIVYFRSLDVYDAAKIAEGMLSEVSERAKDLNIELKFEESVPTHLATNSICESNGARGLRREVVKLIEDPLSEELLCGKIKKGDKVFAAFNDNKIFFSVL